MTFRVVLEFDPEKARANIREAIELYLAAEIDLPENAKLVGTKRAITCDNDTAVTEPRAKQAVRGHGRLVEPPARPLRGFSGFVCPMGRNICRSQEERPAHQVSLITHNPVDYSVVDGLTLLSA